MTALGTRGPAAGEAAEADEGAEEAEREGLSAASAALSLLLLSFASSSIALFALAALAAHSPALAPGTEGPATPLAEITAPLAPREAALSAALAAAALPPQVILFTSVPHEGHLAAENLARQEAEGTPPDHIPASQTFPLSSSEAPP